MVQVTPVILVQFSIPKKALEALCIVNAPKEDCAQKLGWAITWSFTYSNHHKSSVGLLGYRLNLYWTCRWDTTIIGCFIIKRSSKISIIKGAIQVVLSLNEPLSNCFFKRSKWTLLTMLVEAKTWKTPSWHSCISQVTMTTRSSWWIK